MRGALLILLFAAGLATAPARAGGIEVCRQALFQPVAPDEGLRACTEILNSTPNVSWALASRGSLHLRRSAMWEGHEADTGAAHDLQAALSDINKAIELESNADYYGVRGLVHMARSRFYRNQQEIKDAVDDFNRALELSPKSKWLLTQRGVAHEQLGEREKAIADYKLALSGRADEDAREGLRRLRAED